MKKSRKKTKIVRIMPIICIAAIAMLNVMGVSYGVWNERINTRTSLSTGYIEPHFTYQGITDNGSGQLTVELKGRTLEITGTCYPDFSGNISLNVRNLGTLPIVYKDWKIVNPDGIINSIQGLDNHTLLQENVEGNIYIGVQGDSSTGVHSFKHELQFEQGVR
ncbi:MAG: hypothetical protein ACOYVK_16780 [Bacillota bacterium]